MQTELEQLAVAANSFREIAQITELNREVYKDGWTTKQIIAHIVFYHGYYASVCDAKSKGKELPLIDKSLGKVNQETAIEYGKLSREELMNRFDTSQKTLVRALDKLNGNTHIPYKKGGRIYTAKQYLIEITRHLIKHTKDLKRVKRSK